MMLVGVAGPSESGKSHATNYLQDSGLTTRLKLVQVLRTLFDERPHTDDETFDDWPFRIEREDPTWLAGRLAELFAALPRDTVVTIESLYGPHMRDILRSSVDGRFALWFIDAPVATRVVRQQTTADVANLGDAARLVARRDEAKRSAGLETLRQEADLIIVNDASLDALHATLREAVETLNTGIVR